MCEVTISGGGGCPELSVGGELDREAIRILDVCVEGAVEAGAHAVVLNLDETTFVDAQSLAFLVRAWERFGGRDDAVILREAPAALVAVLEVTGVARLVTLETSAIERSEEAPPSVGW